MAMDLCIDEKDEERESEAQSLVRAKARTGSGSVLAVCDKQMTSSFYYRCA